MIYIFSQRFLLEINSLTFHFSFVYFKRMLPVLFIQRSHIAKLLFTQDTVDQNLDFMEMIMILTTFIFSLYCFFNTSMPVIGEIFY